MKKLKSIFCYLLKQKDQYNVALNNLRKENDELKRALADMKREHDRIENVNNAKGKEAMTLTVII